MDAIRKSAYLAHLSTFSDDATLQIMHTQKKQYEDKTFTSMETDYTSA